MTVVSTITKLKAENKKEKRRKYKAKIDKEKTSVETHLLCIYVGILHANT